MATLTTTAKRELTLKDRLSHLSFTQACKLLGPDGASLIGLGGKWNIDIDEQVHLGADLFRLRLDGGVVTITTMAEVPQRLHWNCTACDGACEHVGAAFSLILEEKTSLGLAAPPPERVPIESLSEEELVRQAIAERRERAKTEKMTVRSVEPTVLWTDYVVTNAESGKTYRVALRGWEPGDSYCSCPDFRKNTLGTCKHILAVQDRARKKFPSSRQRRPYVQKDVVVHLHYGRDLELRVLLPERPDEEIAQILRPLAGRPVSDARDLVRRLGRLESLGHSVTVYPDAEEYIQQRLFQTHIDALVTEIRRDPARHPLRRELLKVELLPYQLDGIAFAVGAGRALLADDMGLGKTIQGIGVAELLRREANIRRVLIVCPASLKSQWRSEIQRFCARECQLVLGSAAERAAQYDNDCFFTICNYEQVLRDYLPIERTAWDFIILDEGQRIKNWEAKTSRVIKSLRSRFALALTGTPLENRLDDLFSVVEFIDDRRLGPAFRFFNRHRVTDDKGKVLGYKNLAELRERLKPVLLRRTRALVMKELPPRSTEVVRIAPTAEQQALHDAQLTVVRTIVNKPYISEMDMLRLRRALLNCRMSADSTFLVGKQEPGYSSKLETLDELLGSLLAEEDRKIVLFSEWTTMLGLIETLIRKHRAEYVRLDGSIPQKQRQPLVHKFQRDPSCRLFITTNAGATGLNLQAANTVINVDLPWNPAVLEQRIARAHRMGQQNPVQVYVLVTEGTIEESLLRTLALKHDLALAALDVESETDALDLVSNVEELKNRLEILLGAKPEAPVDESEKARAAAEADREGRRERVALAAGELLGAALTFVDQLLPAPQTEPDQSQRVAEAVRQRLVECVERDDDGRMKLTVTLPDPAALDRLSASLARLLAITPGSGS
ncbi:MAG: helicase [Phycisphaerales bacterium]|nr:MAG: helicase [Phycisphaerales bacterium]